MTYEVIFNDNDAKINRIIISISIEDSDFKDISMFLCKRREHDRIRKHESTIFSDIRWRMKFKINIDHKFVSFEFFFTPISQSRKSLDRDLTKRVISNYIDVSLWHVIDYRQNVHFRYYFNLTQIDFRVE